MTGLRAGDIFKTLQRDLSDERRLVDQIYFSKATTRREMLRAASFLMSGSALAGFMPHALLAGAQAAAAGKAQTPSAWGAGFRMPDAFVTLVYTTS